MAADSHRFEIADALGRGWRTFLPNILPMAVYALVVLAVSWIANAVLGEPGGFFASLFASLVLFVVDQLVAIGWLRIALDAVDGRPVETERIRESFGVLAPYAIAAVVFGIGVAIGMVLLIVPGIIVMLVFGFYGWILVDGVRNDPLEALRRSAEITRGERLHLLGFGLVLALLNVLGALALVVGLLVTLPVSMLAAAHVYRQLEASTAGSRTVEAEDAAAP